MGSLRLFAVVLMVSACTHDWSHASPDAAGMDGSASNGDAAESERDAGDAIHTDTNVGDDTDTRLDGALHVAIDGQAAVDGQTSSDPTSRDVGTTASDATPSGDENATPDSASPATCPAQPDCPAAYPCVANHGGHTCRGERADWPLPLRMSGQSAATQQFVVQSTTLLDSVTGLMWERIEAAQYRTYADAQTYCDGLSLDGYSDFRVPTLIEMATWLGSETVPDLDGALLGTHWNDQHWTSSPDLNDASKNWNVNFGEGNIWSIPQTNTPFVRCVRSHEPRYAGSDAERMSTNANGVTTDRATTLQWQQSVQNADSDIVFGAAQSRCDGLELDGQSDWRLPTYLELLTTFDVGQMGPTQLVSPLLGPTGEQDCYWSSTLSSVHTGERFIAFPGGSALSYDVTKADATCAARCVRK